MKIILILIVLCFSFGSVFAADETLDLMSYEGYRKNVDAYCKLEGNIPNK